MSPIGTVVSDWDSCLHWDMLFWWSIESITRERVFHFIPIVAGRSLGSDGAGNGFLKEKAYAASP